MSWIIVILTAALTVAFLRWRYRLKIARTKEVIQLLRDHGKLKGADILRLSTHLRRSGLYIVLSRLEDCRVIRSRRLSNGQREYELDPLFLERERNLHRE